MIHVCVGENGLASVHILQISLRLPNLEECFHSGPLSILRADMGLGDQKMTKNLASENGTLEIYSC